MLRTNPPGFLAILLLSALSAGCDSGDGDTSTGGQGGAAQGGAGGSTSTGGSAQGGTGGGTSTGGSAQGGAGDGQGGTGGSAQGSAGGGQGGSVDGCVDGMEPDYGVCTGNTFFPDGSCADGSCAATELAKKVYAAWKANAMALSGLGEQALLDRVEISTVEEQNGPSNVFVRIEAVVHIGWIRARLADSVWLGDYPLDNPPTDEQIEGYTKFSMTEEEWTGLGAIDSIVCPEEVVSAFATCWEPMNIDWCHVSFQNVSGKLGVRAYGVVDANANACKESTTDVTTAEQISCIDAPCAIN